MKNTLIYIWRSHTHTHTHTYIYIHICEIWTRICVSWNMVYFWISSISLNSAAPPNFIEKRRVKRLKQEKCQIKITLCESGSKVTSGGACELAWLLTTRQNFVGFYVISPVDMDCAGSSLRLSRFCGCKFSATHRVLKSHICFNINVLNTLICITFILMHLLNNLTGFSVIRFWFSNRLVILI